MILAGPSRTSLSEMGWLCFATVQWSTKLFGGKRFEEVQRSVFSDARVDGGRETSRSDSTHVTVSQVQKVSIGAVTLCLVASASAALAGVQLDEVASRYGVWCTAVYVVASTGLTICYPFLQKMVVERRPATRWTVVACVCIVIILASEAAVSSPFFAGVLMTCVLLVSRTRIMAVLMGSLAGLAELILLLSRPYSFAAKILTVGLDLVTMMILSTLILLARTLVELEVSRERLARLSVDEERSRISRDLHDIIGRTLVAVSLRQEAALNLLDRDVGLARRQLVASGETVREGQAQLRALTHGPMVAGVEEELGSARALCERIGVRFEASAVPVGGADAECALVVREGVTNMLKHADASSCRVEVGIEGGCAVVSVVNDGVVDGRPVGGDGSGVGRMRQRVVLLGGSLEAGPAGGGRFRLRAVIPLVGAE